MAEVPDLERVTEEISKIYYALQTLCEDLVIPWPPPKV